jgi:hypothetical protein
METGSPSGYETDPDRMDWVAVYQDKSYLNHLAGALVYFSAARFRGANLAKQLGEVYTPMLSVRSMQPAHLIT